MLKHSQARAIAEARWGSGGTHSYRTNRAGAFYFSCSGHGGFVIDGRAIKGTERKALEPYVEFEKATEYVWGRHRVLMHPYRIKAAKVALDSVKIHFDFFLLEEDCDWCLAYLFTGIRRNDKPDLLDEAQRTFNQWIKPRYENLHPSPAA